MNVEREDNSRVSQINHINASLKEAKLKPIEEFFRFYHRRWWCYRKTYRNCTRLNPNGIGIIPERKIEMCRYAYKAYEQVLSDLRSYLRGKPFVMKRFITKMMLIDHSITDLFPSISCAIEKQYEDRFFDEDFEVLHTCCGGTPGESSGGLRSLFLDKPNMPNIPPVRP